MTRMIAGAMAGMLLGTMLLAGVVAAAEIEGKIKSVDPSTRSITLENGTELMVPAEVVLDDRLLQPGAEIRASFEEKDDGQKVVMTLEPAR